MREVIRAAVAGEWVQRETELAGVWEPGVVGSNGLWYAPYAVVCDELLEQFPVFSLHGAVQGELATGLRRG